MIVKFILKHILNQRYKLKEMLVSMSKIVQMKSISETYFQSHGFPH
jgi:hypothetical protein